MNVHVSYRLHKIPAVEKLALEKPALEKPALEKEVQHQIEKLQKRLQVFRPDLVHLKGMIEELSAREGTSVSLNLRLPSGQMAVQSTASTAASAVKIAFEDLLQQVNKHKELLRASHKWQRRGNEASERRTVTVPFEQTVAAVFPATVSAADVRSYVNANLSRLERFVEREIFFRETSELIAFDSISKEEVIDETIAAALSDDPESDSTESDSTEQRGREKPERLALEPWLYRLALHALDKLSRPDEGDTGSVHLEESARPRNVKASDEAELQFHQPDESITGETIIADHRVPTPEQIVGSDEMIRLLASALRDVRAPDREAFILHAIEGFAVDEISAITGAAPQRVLASISAARDHLRHSPGLIEQFKSRQFKSRLPPTGTA